MKLAHHRPHSSGEGGTISPPQTAKYSPKKGSNFLSCLSGAIVLKNFSHYLLRNMTYITLGDTSTGEGVGEGEERFRSEGEVKSASKKDFEV